jgi:hypothetical protein
MSQSNELERVKVRIKALTEKTVQNGCTEAEAMSIAEMVGRLTYVAVSIAYCNISRKHRSSYWYLGTTWNWVMPSIKPNPGFYWIDR